MKSKEIILGNVYVNPTVEAQLQKRDKELKELAATNAKHFAGLNLPAAKGDTLTHYLGELTAGYEKEAAGLFLHLQPNSKLPDAKIDADYFKDKDTILANEIGDLEHKNQLELYELR